MTEVKRYIAQGATGFMEDENGAWCKAADVDCLLNQNKMLRLALSEAEDRIKKSRIALRDEFAAAALTGLCVAGSGDVSYHDYAEWSYGHADAMLRARDAVIGEGGAE